MKRWRVPVVLGVLLLGLGGLAYWDEQQTKKDEKKKESENKLADFDLELVTQLAYQSQPQADAESQANESAAVVNVEAKKAEGVWRVTSPVEALGDEPTIRGLLNSLRDYKFEKVVAENKDSWKSFGLDPPLRTLKVTVSDATGPREITVFVGNKAPVGYSVYVATSDSPQVKMGSQYLLTSTAKTLSDFRDKSLAKIEEAAVQTISIKPSRGQPVSFTRKDGVFTETTPSGMAIDAGLVKDFVSELAGTRVDEFLDQPTPAQVAALTPAQRPSEIAWTIEGGASQILFIAEHKGEVLASYNPKVLIFKVSQEAKGKLLKSREDFRDKRLFTLSSATVSSVTIDGAGYAKVENEWFKAEEADRVAKMTPEDRAKPDAPKPATHIKTLLTDLEYARADAFLDRSSPEAKGLPEAPAHKVTLTFQGDGGPAPLVIESWPDPTVKGRIIVRHSAGTQLFRVSETMLQNISEGGEKRQDISHGHDHGGLDLGNDGG